MRRTQSARASAVFPLRTTVPFQRPPWATIVLIVLCVAAFGYELSLPQEALERLIFERGVIPRRHVAALLHAPWRLDVWLAPLFTALFLHGGWLHLIGNMLFLWVFGSGVEQRLGGLRLFALYFACGLLASQAQVMMEPGSPIPMIGASGAIAGMLGAFLVLHPLAAVEVLVPIFIFPLIFLVPAMLFLLFWFAQQVLQAAATSTSLSPVAHAGGVAWWAHAGGFVVGSFLILPLRKHPPVEERKRASVRVWRRG